MNSVSQTENQETWEKEILGTITKTQIQRCEISAYQS